MGTKSFENKVVALLPSKDLKEAVVRQRFHFSEKDLLKFINDYSHTFDEKLKLLEEASCVFQNKKTALHAKKLLEFHQRNYTAFMTPSEDAVYEIDIKCDPADKEDTFITKTFEDALLLIKAFIANYKCVGARDNEKSVYHIVKKTTCAPKKPSEINKTVGELGDCVLGYRLKLKSLDMRRSGVEFESSCRRADSCEECKNPCISSHEPKYPVFLEKYDLVAFVSDNLNDYGKIKYGILGFAMSGNEGDSYVVNLDNEYIKNRNAHEQDKDGYYEVFLGHCHPSYATLFKPAKEEVPADIYADYLYAVEELKKIDAKYNGFG
ncbi:MAG: hypothetical protein K2K12_02090 [Clostridia bacterium]|nr:hypothetical protein [Clostridia bacterium]